MTEEMVNCEKVGTAIPNCSKIEEDRECEERCECYSCRLHECAAGAKFMR